jgi:hypothetical protein
MNRSKPLYNLGVIKQNSDDNSVLGVNKTLFIKSSVSSVLLKISLYGNLKVKYLWFRSSSLAYLWPVGTYSDNLRLLRHSLYNLKSTDPSHPGSLRCYDDCFFSSVYPLSASSKHTVHLSERWAPPSPSFIRVFQPTIHSFILHLQLVPLFTPSARIH